MAEVLIDLIAKITTDASDLKRGLSDAEKATEKTSKSIQKSLGDIGSKMSSVGKQMSMKLTAPIVGVGAAAFKMSGDFDQAFRKVNVMLGASAEEAINYKERILEISSATGKSATEVADAFYQIVSAGYRGADSLDILETAMRGAVGGAAETERTTAALTKAMNIFQLEGVEGSSKAMDVFFGIVDTGLLSFEQMAKSFPRAASNAAGLGISIEETGAALGTLSKVLGSTEQAATAVDATLRMLISPSEAMNDLFAEWGVKSGPEAIEKFGGLTNVLRKLRETTGGEVVAIRELFASDEAMRGILPLLTSSYEDYNEAVKTVTDSQGKTNDAFNEMAKGPGFAMQQTFIKMKNAGIKLGDTLATYISPALDKLGVWISKAIEWFKQLDPQTQKTILIFVGIVAAIGPLLIILGQLAMAISFLISPIGLVMAALIGLIAVGILLWRNWDTISAKAIEIWDGIVGFFKDTWEKITGFFKEHWDKILAILFPAIGIPILIKREWDNIKRFLQSLNPWEWIKAGWDKLTSGIKGVLNNIFGHSIINDWVKGLSGYLSSVDLGGAGKSMFGTLEKSVKESLSGMTGMVSSWAQGLPGAISGGAPTAPTYGSAAERLSEQYGMSQKSAQETIERYSANPQSPEFAPVKGIMESIVGYKQGGYVNETGLAFLHAGETVIPANESMGNVNINFTQPVFFDREDTMNRFVDKISKTLDRKYRLRFGGAYSG